MDKDKVKEDESNDLWTPYKRLQSVVEIAISHPSEESYDQLVNLLQKSRQNFLSIFCNPGKNKQHRDEINKGCVGKNEQVSGGAGSGMVLPRELINETIILSDMYDLDEYTALNLLGTAQIQMMNYPGLSRGVVAVLLYYDGRKSLVWALRTLAEASRGNSWKVDTSEKVQDFITKYVDHLVAEGIISKILTILENSSVEKEMELLQRNRALGPQPYQQQVKELLTSTRTALSDFIFFCSAQLGLPKEPTLSLLEYLRQVNQPDENQVGLESDSVALVMAFLYFLDSQTDPVGWNSWLLRDGQCMETIERIFVPGKGGEATKWASSGLGALLTMAWAISSTALRRHPLLPTQGQLENPDIIMDYAIENSVFVYLKNTFLNSESLFNKNEFYARRVHQLFVNIITLMPQKVKELRLKAEETDQTIMVYLNGGIDPPKKLVNNYEKLLLSMAKFYSQEVHYHLCEDFWFPSNMSAGSLGKRSSQHSLYSFLLSTGESLVTTLFVPFLKLLTGLSTSPKAAMKCWTYLRDIPEGPLKPSLTHFFNTLNRYLNSLLMETVPVTDTFYRHRNTKGIRPEELEGLLAVLDLIRVVSRNNGECGQSICGNESYNACAVLVGLSSCPLDLTLKGKILETLAAFASSSANEAERIWRAIESAQIILTYPSTTSTFFRRTILVDVEDVESRQEEYPVSKAWLILMSDLVEKVIPVGLGSPDRDNGIEPYLKFSLEHIVLRLYNRRFRKEGEMWQLMDLGMELVKKLLLQYDPSKHAVGITKSAEVQSVRLNSSSELLPGYYIMVSLSSQTDLLRMCLRILDEGSQMLDTYCEFDWLKSVVKTVLSVLDCFVHTLTHQQALLSQLSPSDMLHIQGLTRLLHSLNPATNRVDYLFSITKFVTYGRWEHALAAVRILRLAGMSGPLPRSHLLAIVTSSPALRLSVRHGFVTLLESEHTETSGPVIETKCAVIHLLLVFLQYNCANLAHYLLGFDLNKDLKKTVFEQPGVNNMPRTCLHSVICGLNGWLENRQTDQEAVISSYYQLIHALAAEPRTSEPVLRFLRGLNFLKEHLCALPFSPDPNAIEKKQMAWLLQAVCVEVKMIASGQRSELVSIINTFVGNGATEFSFTAENGLDSIKETKSSKEPIIFSLLRCIDFSFQPIPNPELKYFVYERLMNDQNLTPFLVEQDSVKVVDLNELRNTLENNINIAVNSGDKAALHKTKLRKEMEVIIEHVKQWNDDRLHRAANTQLFSAWCQLLEIICIVSPKQVLSTDVKINLLIEVIRQLLTRVILSNNEAGLHHQVGETILMLSSELSRSCSSLLPQAGSLSSSQPLFLDSFRKLKVIIENNVRKLSDIVTLLGKWIPSCGSLAQKERMNMYSCVINVVNVMSMDLCGRGIEGQKGSEGHCLDRSSDESVLGLSTSSLRHSAVDLLLANKDKFLQILCHDSSYGHDICKMVSLSLMNLMVEKDRRNDWPQNLSKHGYFSYLSESILASDNELLALFSPDCSSLRPLFVYQAKMAFLCRVASTKSGASVLVKQEFLNCFSFLSVLSRHPQIKSSYASGNQNEIIPSIHYRYLQIISPVLLLCNTLITTLGNNNETAVGQVMQFVVCQGETVSQILRCGSPYHSLPFLNELAHVTGVIAQLVAQGDSAGLSRESNMVETCDEMTARLHRFKFLMLVLLSRFVISESLFRQMESEDQGHSAGSHSPSQPSSVLTFLKIASHLALYAKNLVSGSGGSSRVNNIIFQPTLSEVGWHAIDREEGGFNCGGEATLGTVVHQLCQAVAHHQKENTNLQMTQRKFNSLPNMSTTTMKELFCPGSEPSLTDIEEMRKLAYKVLLDDISAKKEQLNHCDFIIKNCLFIVWSHLDFFMFAGISSKTFDLPTAAKQRGAILKFDVAWSVSVEDIIHLKRGLVSIFNDTFIKTLIASTEGKDKGDKLFVESLVRRIQKLIQFAPSS